MKIVIFRRCLLSLAIILAVSGNVCTVQAGICSDGGIKVFIEQKEIRFDVDPVIENGQLLVPVRKICEALGAEVLWDDSKKTVTIYKSGIIIELNLNSDHAKINGNTVKLNTFPKTINGRILVPLRFIGENFKFRVVWNGNLKAVNIYDLTHPSKLFDIIDTSILDNIKSVKYRNEIIEFETSDKELINSFVDSLKYITVQKAEDIEAVVGGSYTYWIVLENNMEYRIAFNSSISVNLDGHEYAYHKDGNVSSKIQDVIDSLILEKTMF